MPGLGRHANGRPPSTGEVPPDTIGCHLPVPLRSHRGYCPRVAGYRQVSVVGVGGFNPLIFQPEWFRRHQLLPDAEIDASIEAESVVTRQLTLLQFESLRLMVRPDRWELATPQPDWFDDLGAIVGSIFAKLPHTPLERIGLNHFGHFTPAPPITKQALLARWLPLTDFGATVGEEARPSGTVSAVWGQYRARVVLEASERLKDALFINQNYERQDAAYGEDLAAVLSADWQKFLTHANDLAAKLLAG